MNLRRNVYLIFLIRHKYYQDTVDALRSVFNRLNLVLVGEAAIHFKDAEAGASALVYGMPTRTAI